MAYLQVAALGRAGEPDTRVVFFFSIASMGGGALVTFLGDGWHAHTLHGLGLLLAVGLLATLAQLLLTRAYAIGKLLVNGSLQYLGIAWSYLYGMLLFGDRITGVSLLGMGLIALAGITATALREPLASPGEMETSERL
jgi:S-adenosylmethionine uptake transporter